MVTVIACVVWCQQTMSPCMPWVYWLLPMYKVDQWPSLNCVQPVHLSTRLSAVWPTNHLSWNRSVCLSVCLSVTFDLREFHKCLWLLLIPDKIVRLIRVLYSNSVSCVRASQSESAWSTIVSGQGCVLAPDSFNNNNNNNNKRQFVRCRNMWERSSWQLNWDYAVSNMTV